MEVNTGETIGLKRKLDNLGRATLPVEFRKHLGIDTNETVEMFLIKDGILIRKGR